MSNNTNPGHAVNAPGAVIEREELAGPDVGIEPDSGLGCQAPSLDSFQRLLQFGRLLPLAPGEKAPDGRLVPQGFHNATDDPAVVARWWAGGVRGYGLLADHLIIDLDTAEDQQAFARLCRSHGFALNSWAAQTPRGMHIHLAVPSDWTCSTRKGFDLGPGCRIDIQGLGRAYVVAPPTEMPPLVEGGEPRRYRWAEGAAPWECLLQPAPDWLLSLLSPGAGAAPSMTTAAVATADGWTAILEGEAPPYSMQERENWIRWAVEKAVRETSPGNRNDRLVWLAQQLHYLRVPFDAAVELIEGAWWSQIDNSDFSRRQMRATVRGCYKQAMKEWPLGENSAIMPPTLAPVAAPLVAGAGPDILTLTEEQFAALPAGPAPKGRAQASMTREEILAGAGDGLVGRLARFIDATSCRQQPWLSLGAALTLVGCAAGRRYRDRQDTRTNLYTLALAESGAGKEHARSVIKALLAKAGLTDLLGGERIASHAGIISMICQRPRALLLVDEIGLTLQTICAPKAPPHLAECRPVLMQLMTSCNSLWTGAEYGASTKTERPQVAQPCLVLYGTSTGDSVWNALTSAAAVNGFLNRFLLLVSDDPAPPKRKPGLLEIPDDLVEGLHAVDQTMVRRFPANINDAPLPALTLCPFIVESHDDAEACFDRFGERLERMRVERIGTPLAALPARAEEQARKVALIRAIGDDPAMPFISPEIAAWAVAIAEHSLIDLIEHAEGKIADNALHQSNRKILNLILQAGPRGIAKSELTRSTQEMTSRERDDHLKNLIEGGEIEAFSVAGKGSGRIGIRYRAASKGARAA